MNLADLRGQTLSAPWVWLDGRFQSGVRIRVNAEGRIAEILTEEQGPEGGLGRGQRRMDNVALLPGFVNAHSHAFHRCLRGRSQVGGSGADSFWKWRQNMYALVQSVDFGQMKKMCADTFREMLSAGITTVGEFHYVHHASADQTGKFALDMAVVEAALEVGIRLVLIETLYERSGFAAPGLEPEQWRFDSAPLEEFLAHVERLQGEIGRRGGGGLVSLALAIHSLRAVPVESARRLFQFALWRQLPLHIHLEEQPAEVEQCRAAQGLSPGRLLLDSVLSNGTESAAPLSPPFTAVHCTFSERPVMDQLAARKAHICICPATEGFLGDGVPGLGETDRLCLGTDCNNRIAMLEEMRWLAFTQNAHKNCRNWAKLDARKLLEIATKNGASSLGLAQKTGEFAVGQWMDFVAIDCKSLRIAPFVGQNGEQLLDAIVFGAGNAEVAATAVAGSIKYANKK